MDLFSGIGGLSLALAPWVQTIAYCENDRYAQAVLCSRMSQGQLPLAAIWDDITTLTARDLCTNPDIIFGGFPCQDLSVAGNGQGLAGERSGLVFEVFRLAAEIKPDFIFLENVPAIRTRGAERVVKELATLGYDARWDVLSAYDVGAPHLRERWWLLAANADRIRLRHWGQRSEKRQAAPDCLARHDGAETWRETEPPICGMDDGLPHRMDRVRAVGNSVVPAQAREAFKRLMGIE